MNKETLKNHLLFFLIYQKKVIRMLFTMFQICILKELELLKITINLRIHVAMFINGNKNALKNLKSKGKTCRRRSNRNIKIIPQNSRNFLNNNDIISAFKLGYWFEKFSPEIDFEKSYLWYSVSVSAGVYKAMKLRDRVGELIDKKK